MKSNKSAFTIPELLIFMTIVGVVSVTMMSVIKSTERYLPYAYYNAYNALSTAAMNIREDALDNNLQNDETIDINDKFFPGDSSTGQTGVTAARELCKKLAIKASTADEYGYINTTENKCDTFTPVASTGAFSDTDDVGKYAFRASNSMLFYISQPDSLDVEDDLITTAENTKTTVNYFIVWVDLNGDRRPNTATWSARKSADIVPFIVTTGGQVLPAGGPITDIRYTTARVQYATDTMNRYLPRSTSYLEAQIRAYGDKQYPSYDQFSINDAFRTKFASTLYAENQAEITKITGRVSVDDKCNVDVEGNSICTIIVDENVRM